jgi:uncharacterized protein (DUF1684 family)
MSDQKSGVKLSFILKTSAILGAAVIAFSIFISNYESSYEQQIHRWRKEKNDFLKNDESSPIADKENFKGLNYFVPDIKYKVEAHLVPLNDTTPFTVIRTDGKRDQYFKYAIATFELDKKEYQVILLKSAGKEDEKHENLLFLPFTDKTTGELTYITGRYLDVELKDKDKVIIDFNFAYNPFCAYNPRYSCPIPPKENYLDVEILAGEKIYKKETVEILIN